eukprot:g1696.t1
MNPNGEQVPNIDIEIDYQSVSTNRSPSPSSSNASDKGENGGKIGTRYRVLFDYTAREEEDLSVRKGDILVGGVKPGASEWLIVSNERNDEVGEVPSTYTEEILETEGGRLSPRESFLKAMLEQIEYETPPPSPNIGNRMQKKRMDPNIISLPPLGKVENDQKTSASSSSLSKAISSLLPRALVKKVPSDEEEDVIEKFMDHAAVKVDATENNNEEKMNLNGEEEVNHDDKKTKSLDNKLLDLFEWSELQDEEGNIYYYNNVSGVSQWEPPSGWISNYDWAKNDNDNVSSYMNSTIAVYPLADGWIEMTDISSGAPFFKNTLSGLSQWERPLRGGWTQHFDQHSGFPYFENSETGETTWFAPKIIGDAINSEKEKLDRNSQLGKIERTLSVHLICENTFKEENSISVSETVEHLQTSLELLEKKKTQEQFDLENTLHDMGFPRDCCVEALKCSNGDISKAVQWLLDNSAFLEEEEKRKKDRLEHKKNMEKWRLQRLAMGDKIKMKEMDQNQMNLNQTKMSEKPCSISSSIFEGLQIENKNENEKSKEEERPGVYHIQGSDFQDNVNSITDLSVGTLVKVDWSDIGDGEPEYYVGKVTKICSRNCDVLYNDGDFEANIPFEKISIISGRVQLEKESKSENSTSAAKALNYSISESAKEQLQLLKRIGLASFQKLRRQIVTIDLNYTVDDIPFRKKEFFLTSNRSCASSSSISNAYTSFYISIATSHWNFGDCEIDEDSFLASLEDLNSIVNEEKRLYVMKTMRKRRKVLQQDVKNEMLLLSSSYEKLKEKSFFFSSSKTEKLEFEIDDLLLVRLKKYNSHLHNNLTMHRSAWEKMKHLSKEYEMKWERQKKIISKFGRFSSSPAFEARQAILNQFLELLMQGERFAGNIIANRLHEVNAVIRTVKASNETENNEMLDFFLSCDDLVGRDLTCQTLFEACMQLETQLIHADKVVSRCTENLKVLAKVKRKEEIISIINEVRKLLKMVDEKNVRKMETIPSETNEEKNVPPLETSSSQKCITPLLPPAPSLQLPEIISKQSYLIPRRIQKRFNSLCMDFRTPQGQLFHRLKQRLIDHHDSDCKKQNEKKGNTSDFSIISLLPETSYFFAKVIEYDFDLDLEYDNSDEVFEVLKELVEELFYSKLLHIVSTVSSIEVSDFGDNLGDSRVWLEQQQWMRLLTPIELDVPIEFIITQNSSQEKKISSPFPKTSFILSEFSIAKSPTQQIRLLLTAIKMIHNEANSIIYLKTKERTRKLLEADKLLPILIVSVIHADAVDMPNALRRALIFGNSTEKTGEASYYLVCLQSAVKHILGVRQTSEQVEIQRKRVRAIAVHEMQLTEIAKMKSWVKMKQNKGKNLLDYITETEDRVSSGMCSAEVFLQHNDENWKLSDSWKKANESISQENKDN